MYTMKIWSENKRGRKEKEKTFIIWNGNLLEKNNNKLKIEEQKFSLGFRYFIFGMKKKKNNETTISRY